ncbi:MAG: class I SAM-dependent methyltransferase [Desulfobacterales bacterium]|nr:class I SAM-dependent methyltransferase [Desulfobacterales bacterium]
MSKETTQISELKVPESLKETNSDRSWDIKNSYIHYFHSGTYDKRYPCPNRRTMDIVFGNADLSKHILDYGCGNGRYTIPLLRNTAAQISVYDTCDFAVKQLNERVQSIGLSDRINNLTVENLFDSKEKYDLILGLFGVLSHINKRDSRVQLLKKLFTQLKEEGGLIISVPNSIRRFPVLQAKYALYRKKGIAGIASEHGDVKYERKLGGKKTEFYYHLYNTSRLLSEIKQAGFTTEIITAESILPESQVVRSDLKTILDKYLCRLLPAKLGYGLLVVARKKKE